MAPRKRDRVVAARPHCNLVHRATEPRQIFRPCFRFGGGPLEESARHRIRRSLTRIIRGSLRAILIARRERFRMQDSFCDALPVRRAPRKEGLNALVWLRLGAGLCVAHWEE